MRVSAIPVLRVLMTTDSSLVWSSMPSQEAIRTLSEQPMIDHPVFICAVGVAFFQSPSQSLRCPNRVWDCIKKKGSLWRHTCSRENWYGQGLNAAPPPRPLSHKYFGACLQNPRMRSKPSVGVQFFHAIHQYLLLSKPPPCSIDLIGMAEYWSSARYDF